MKTFALRTSAIVCAFALILTATMATSCKKDKTTYGTVTVQTTSGKLVSGAKVLLSAAAVAGEKTYEGVTDGSGEAEFEIALPGIWDVTVTKDSLSGTGVLRLDEPGKSDNTTITVR